MLARRVPGHHGTTWIDMAKRRMVRSSRNFTIEEFPDLKIWYSYSTPIAFEKNGQRFVSENLWSVTTARHIGYLQHDKRMRLNRQEFEEMLEKAQYGACRS